MSETINLDAHRLLLREKQAASIDAEAMALAQGGGPPHTPDMNERLAKLEGSYDALKVVRPMTIAVISVFLAALVFVIGILGIQVSRVDTKLDAIPGNLATEFRAMRADMAAQTSAIANSITAAKQQPPQVILMPSQQTQQPPALVQEKKPR